MKYVKVVVICFLSSLLVTGCVSRPVIKRNIIAAPTVPLEKSHEQKAETSPAPAAVLTPAPVTVTAIQPGKPVITHNIPQLKVGTRYVYRMDWLLIPVGHVKFEITGEEKINGRDTYVLVLTAESNKFASKIYKIEDKYTSYIDKETLLPVRYDVKRAEGNYRKNAVTYFDREKCLAYFENFKDGSKKTYAIPKDVLDPVSCIVKIWGTDFVLGNYYSLDVANNEQIYRINTHVAKKEFIRVKGLGDFEAFYICPDALVNGERVRKGTVFGWISTSSPKTLLFAEGRASLFSKMTATLVETNVK